MTKNEFCDRVAHQLGLNHFDCSKDSYCCASIADIAEQAGAKFTYDIKKCPFCASEARCLEFMNTGLTPHQYRVMCHNHACGGTTTGFHLESEAIAAWNLRTFHWDKKI